MMQRASLFVKHTSKRALSTYAAASQQSPSLSFTRADLHEYPELNRSFMKVLDSGIDTQSADYLDNYRLMAEKNAELDSITQAMMHVDNDYREKAIKRDKLLPRERINAILDQGTPFLELGQLAGYNSLKPQDSVPSGNIITVIGMVGGRQCMIIANNHSFRAGSYYPITVKKHVRAQEIAEENNLPCIYMVDSAGAFLPQ